MKDGKRTAFWLVTVGTVIAVFLGAGFLTVCSLWDRAGIVDEKDSPDGRYSVVLCEPSPFSFDASSGETSRGRLILRKGMRKLAEYEFVLSGRQDFLSPGIWRVSWRKDCAEVQIFRTEQSDILAELDPDGEVRISLSGGHRGGENGPPGVKKPAESMEQHGEGCMRETETAADKSLSEQIQEETEKTEETMRTEETEEERLIREGYEAVCSSLSEEQGGCFRTEYDAKGNSRVYVYEDSAEVRYLVYNRQSRNGLCGLYVYYSSRKDENGGWSSMDASILTMYAYVYETDGVIDSGKRHWEDTGSEAYRNAAGEP